jgi:hypothetical protein
VSNDYESADPPVQAWMSGDAITFWSFDTPDTAALVSVRPLLEFCCHQVAPECESKPRPRAEP